MTERVVVIGHGMVAHRFIDELDALAVPGTIELTVLGAERFPAYNRLMLTEVIAGRVPIDELTLPAAPAWVRLHTGVAAVSVDTEQHLVFDDAGAQHAYDTLVFATGAEAARPALTGLDATQPFPPGIQALRTTEDVTTLLGEHGPQPGSHVAVLGGGLLGIEVARALATRAVRCTVVHSGEHVLDRQLHPAAGAVVGLQLQDLGTAVLTQARASGVLLDSQGGVTGLRLSDRSTLPTDHIVLTAGIRPRTEIAAAARIPCERGIIVGPDLRSPTHPHVAAIGDCAQPPGGGTGLLAPGWAQAAQLARQLCAMPTEPAGTTDTGVVKLKASDVHVAAIGHLPEANTHGPRVIALSDPHARRHVEVAVQDGALVGACCVGDPELAADLIARFSHGLPLSADPAHLLVKGLGNALPQADSPTQLPDRATICRCNGVTKGELVAGYEAGCRTVGDLACRTRATTGCGTCRGAVQGILDWMASVDPDQPERPPSQPQREQLLARP